MGSVGGDRRLTGEAGVMEVGEAVALALHRRLVIGGEVRDCRRLVVGTAAEAGGMEGEDTGGGRIECMRKAWLEWLAEVGPWRGMWKLGDLPLSAWIPKILSTDVCPASRLVKDIRSPSLRH